MTIPTITINSTKMRSVITTKYGSPEVLQIQEIEKPLPKENEVLIKIYASSVTAADTMMRKGDPFYGRLFIGLTKPKNPIPGTGFAGIIEAVGSKVSSFKKGDKVFGESIFSDGTHTEYVCVPEDGIISTLPKNMSFEEAAGICDGALTSMNFLKEVVNIKKGDKIIINGASGSLGTAAVQLAKYYGAEVTGICSGKNAELVLSLGANHVIDYTKEDFTKSNEKYDFIYDTIGTLSFSKCKKSLNKNGVFMSPVLSMALLFKMISTSIFGNKKAKFSATGMLPVPKLRELLDNTKSIIEEGKLKSVMDKEYTLDQIVEAHQYIDSGRKVGNVVITME